MGVMRYKKNTIIIGGFLAVLILGLSGFYLYSRSKKIVPPVIVQTEPLRIGAIAPLTSSGTASREDYGIRLRRAAQLAVDEINAKGGINGEQVQIFWEDGKCNAEAATRAARKLVEEKKVQYLLGGVCSLETLAAATYAEQKKTILISAASTSPEISNKGEYIFRLAPSDTFAGKAMIRAAADQLQGKKIAILSAKTAYNQGVREGMLEEARARSLEIVFDEIYNVGRRDTAAYIKTIIEKTPDVIVLLPESITQGLQQLERIKKEEKPPLVLVGEVMLDREQINTNKETFENVRGLEGYFDSMSREAQKFLTSYETQFAEPPKYPYFMSNMYDAVYLMREAVSRFGVDTEKARAWMSQLSNWHGASGEVTFDVNGDRLPIFNLVQVRGGEVIPEARIQMTK